MGWQRDPVLALEALGGGDPVASRPAVLCSPALRVCLGGLAESVAGAFGSGQRKLFEQELFKCILDAGSPHISAFSTPGGQQSLGTRACACDLQFKAAEGATAFRQALADEGRIGLHASTGEVILPVRSVPGRIPSDCALVHVHGLPAEFARKGVIAALLSCAGYDGSSVVRAEFGGELPAALAADHPDVVRGDVLVGVVTVPQGDASFQQLPRCFYDHGNGTRIAIAVHSHQGARQAASRPTTSTPESSAPAQSAPESASRRSQRTHRRALQRGAPQSSSLRATFVPASNVPAGGAPAPGPASGRPRRGNEVIDHFEHMAARLPSDQRRGLGYAPACPPPPPGFQPSPPLEGGAGGLGQPRLPDRMEVEARDEIGEAPLFQRCVYWLEDQVPDLRRGQRREAVYAFAKTCPAAWEASCQASCVPGGAFRNQLLAVVRRMFERASAFIPEDEDVGAGPVNALCERAPSGEVQTRSGAQQPTLRQPYRPPCRRQAARAGRPSWRAPAAFRSDRPRGGASERHPSYPRHDPGWGGDPP